MTEQDTLQTPADSGSAGLGSLKLAQLQTLASQLGITGTSRMRKAQLVEVIADHQRGGDSADREAVEEAKAAAAKERKSRSASAKAKAGEQPVTDDAPAEEPKQRPKEDTSATQSSQQRDDKQRSGEQSKRDAQRSKQDETDGRDDDRDRDQRTRNQQRRDQDRQRKANRDQHDKSDKDKSDKRDQQSKRDQQDKHDKQEKRDQQGGDEAQDDHRDGNRRRRDDDQRNQRRQRQRDRNRSRDRRDDHEQDDRHEGSEDETLIPISGILDVLDNYAFVRTSGYLPGPNDVYVSMAMVKRYGLRKGDAIRGQVRSPEEGDDQQSHNKQGGSRGGRGGRGGRNRRGGGNRQKFNALVKLDLVNGQQAAEHPKRVEFNKLTPLYPQERLRLENVPKDMGPRLVDLVAPIGKGQRGLIVSPPKAGKTMMLQSIANAITTNNPEVKLMMVLVDERPEEVTDMQRSVRGEVIASTFDRPAEDHTTVAELTIERAKRMVELGHDVVVLLDSMTRLGRAYNLTQPASGRILSGGVDSAALYPPKKFFGAARNIEGGGSLTILATALVETGSRMDEVIFEEFKGTGNMELRLSRDLSERRIFPAIDINASGTRREENLLTAEEIRIMWRLRRMLSGLETQQALELLTSKLKETETNAEFLMLVSKTTLRAQAES
ncbi:MAG TPA: transcription termination factor Rho [Candidatus Yaniella excrementigallinarum]|nr:transcription termination factor Rho [Candidatus Yaniella excrementigallinarum]